MAEQAKTMWDEKIDYLRDSRKDMWNLDYWEFLVNKVWAITNPVRIVDFGCGMGYLGAVLLPLLPKGSTYTGLDNSPKLLEQALEYFADTDWPVEFIEQDLSQYEPKDIYDIAICQTVLVHIPTPPSPAAILKKMAQSVIPGGRVICIEPNWAFTHFGVYRHGMETYQYDDWGLRQKMFDYSVQKGERDPYIGMKIPAMMYEIGLKNIDIRIGDKANFKAEAPEKEYFSRDIAERRKKSFYKPDNYVSNGLNASEAERHVESILRTEDYIISNDKPVVSAMAWLISYGER